MGDTANRRPLKSRGTAWASWLTTKLVATSITPNQISQMSIYAAAIAGILFFCSAGSEGVLRVACLLGGALFCQLRLLCNLMDGLVAVEGGKSSPDGAFWNEFPDRLADILILVGLGWAAGAFYLGWAAATFAVLTAYIRELGVANGHAPDFSGPMAKPHRMAAVTIGALLAIFEPYVTLFMPFLQIVLCVIIIGTAITCVRRALRLVKAMNTQGE